MFKSQLFETYNTVQEQFQIIRNLNSFNTYTCPSTDDLMLISNITIDCVDKLSEISSFYIKKAYDATISMSTIDKVHKMNDIHNELLNNIYKFNLISSDVTERFIDIFTKNLSQDVINFIYYDIINRYKMIIFQIFDSINKLNIYVGFVKDKII